MVKSLPRLPITRTVVSVAAIFVALLGVQVLAPLITPFLMALVFAVLLYPLTQWLKAKGLPSWLALMITAVGVIILGLSLILIMGISLSRFSVTVADYQIEMEGLVAEIQNALTAVGMETDGQTFGDADSVQRFLEILIRLLGGVLGLMASALFILLLLVFMLIDAPKLSSKLQDVVDGDNPLLAQASRLSSDINRYIVIRVRVNLLVATLVTVMLFLLGIDLALLWGLLAFFMSFVPYIGLTLAAIPPVVLALLSIGPAGALAVAAGYLVINFTAENGFAPRMMGQGLNLSPLVVFFSFFFWGWLLGIAGIFLTMPITIVLVLILNTFANTRWLARLMMGAPSA